MIPFGGIVGVSIDSIFAVCLLIPPSPLLRDIKKLDFRERRPAQGAPPGIIVTGDTDSIFCVRLKIPPFLAHIEIKN